MDLGLVGERNVENIKQSILIIEGFSFAVNNSQIPMRFAEAALKGMGFLHSMHASLISQLTPEELEEMKKQYSNTPPIIKPNEVA